MSLLALWNASKAELASKNVEQLISIAGDGKLRNDSATAHEFRELLSNIPSELLTKYARHCLDSAFKDSGLALQDIVNEIGNRLGFDISFGKYQGTKDGENYDGLWKTPNEHHIIVEVKTTDTYRIDLDKLALYRKDLVQRRIVDGSQSSILLVVGREDTGGLESQVRGSKHAWDIRLISVDALVSLMVLKEEMDDPSTLNQINEILLPKEYTKLDQIVELICSAADDAKNVSELSIDHEQEVEPGKKFTPVKFRDACIERISEKMNLNFIKRSYGKFETSDKATGLLCIISKKHESPSRAYYWFALHPHQMDFLQGQGESHLAFGCGSQEQILIFPLAKIKSFLKKFNQTTTSNGRTYWHVHIYQATETSDWWLALKGSNENISVQEYLLE